jgi:hypothetical protein
MGQTTTDIAFDLGRRLRHQRYRADLTQEEAAATAGTSASTISRMELGQGATVPLGVWLDVAGAVGSDLFAWRRGPEGIHLDAFARLALEGEWVLAGRRVDVCWFDRAAHPIRYVSTVLRPPERVVVRIVTVLTALPVEVGRLASDVSEIASTTAPGRSVAGMVLVVRSARNVRIAGAGARRSTGGWIRAIRDPRARMPSRPGVVWMTSGGTHLLPAA